MLASANGSMMETSNFSSIKSAVTFIDTLDQYPSDEDVTCRFRFNSYTPQEGDRIAIFKFGWMYVKDYLVFEWAPLESTGAAHTVVFNKHTLPKNSSELYQFCYVSGENELQGASQMFSFACRRPSPRQPPQDELSRVKEENAVLRKAFKCLTFQGENSSKEIAELKECFEELNRKFREQQEEMKSLKQRFAALEKSVQRGGERAGGQQARRPPPIGEVEFDIMGLQNLPPFPFPK